MRFVNGIYLLRLQMIQCLKCTSVSWCCERFPAWKILCPSASRTAFSKFGQIACQPLKGFVRDSPQNDAPKQTHAKIPKPKPKIATDGSNDNVQCKRENGIQIIPGLVV